MNSSTDTLNILSATYLGNIQYYTKLCFTACVTDIHENYLKQSYRNRCTIMTAGGPVPLTVNVAKDDGSRKMKDIRIDYSKRWQHRHWNTITSAYRSSPYFSFYEDDFAPFYSRRYDFLLDLDLELTAMVLKLLGSDAAVQLSENYIEISRAGTPDKILSETPHEILCDHRNSISPKTRLNRPDHYFRPEPYWQVFSDRLPFTQNLSIIDLLFCEGPGAMDILKRSYISR